MYNGPKKRGAHARSRKYRGILGPRPDLKHLRQASAAERKQTYDALTPEQKLKLLDDDCRRAVKQRARLMTIIAARAAERIQHKKDQKRR